MSNILNSLTPEQEKKLLEMLSGKQQKQKSSMDEKERLQFIIDRAENKNKGTEEAVEFAKRGLNIYIEEALRRCPSLYKKINTYRMFLEEHGYVVINPGLVIRK